MTAARRNVERMPSHRLSPKWLSPCACARWLRKARPSDYAIAVNDLCAALPVVGKPAEVMGSLAAVGVWGSRHVPALATAAVRKPFGLGALFSLGLPTQAQVGDERAQTTTVAEAALRDILSGDPLAVDWPRPDRLAPVLHAVQHRRRHLYRSAVRYGDAAEQVLDVWRSRDLPVQPAPVLIFVPGGAWVHGSRILQGHTLMSHLAEQGWVCLAIDYRVAPRHRWPRHIQDVRRPSRGRGPMSTNSAATEGSWRWPAVRQAGTWRHWRA